MSRSRPEESKLRLDSPVTDIAGIGAKRAQALAARRIHTAHDLILHIPARYIDWRERTHPRDLKPGVVAVLEGLLGEIKERPMRGRGWRRIATGTLNLADGATIRIVWFNLPAHMRGALPAGKRVLVRGRAVEDNQGFLELAHPEVAVLDDELIAEIRPAYRLPADIPQRVFATAVRSVLAELNGAAPSAIPDQMRADNMTVCDALDYIHHPPTDADTLVLNRADSPAHRALALDELFAFEIAMAVERRRSARRAGARLDGKPTASAAMLAALPFSLTGAQHRAIAEIAGDLERPIQMNRMLLGDVGSGKTAVALWAALKAVESGWQCAMIAPTELLAEQHYRTFERLCRRTSVRAGLLTGGVTGAARSQMLRGLASGEIHLAFGTHALTQARVRFARLGLGIIDEQHRFGVFDRARVKELGSLANVLTMTATPIPRSLAMSLFANLDISILDEMPSGRAPISTELRLDIEMESIYRDIDREVATGGRVFFVVPLVRGEAEDSKSVAESAKRISRASPRIRVGLLHGRMRAEEKDRTMRAFRDGALDVLVSTTVVEVGIDVPEASMIVIDAAHRYGLAQLHQMRGRVGRGTRRSRCILLAGDAVSGPARERLEVMCRCASGMELAEEDLRLRGPGDLLGARQSGALPLRFVHLIRDAQLIVRAREMADRWIEIDPSLSSPESAGARRALADLMTEGFSLADIG
jgi:ATP-dependent DNA helicase RecG